MLYVLAAIHGMSADMEKKQSTGVQEDHHNSIEDHHYNTWAWCYSMTILIYDMTVDVTNDVNNYLIND